MPGFCYRTLFGTSPLQSPELWRGAGSARAWGHPPVRPPPAMEGRPPMASLCEDLLSPSSWQPIAAGIPLVSRGGFNPHVDRPERQCRQAGKSTQQHTATDSCLVDLITLNATESLRRLAKTSRNARLGGAARRSGLLAVPPKPRPGPGPSSS